MNTARAAAVARRAAGVLACALLAGCAGGGAGAAKASEEPIEGRVVRARTTVAAGQTGLEVITWQVTDEGRRVSDALLAHGESPRDASLPAVDHAAWTQVAAVLLYA